MRKKESELRKFIWEVEEPLQVACEYTNTGLSQVYLTNSGLVCREEFGFIEDLSDYPENYRTLSIKTRSWASIKRLQAYLQANS